MEKLSVEKLQDKIRETLRDKFRSSYIKVYIGRDTFYAQFGENFTTGLGGLKMMLFDIKCPVFGFEVYNNGKMAVLETTHDINEFCKYIKKL